MDRTSRLNGGGAGTVPGTGGTTMAPSTPSRPGSPAGPGTPGTSDTSGREWLDEHGNKMDDHDRGLVFGLQTLVDRRRALTLFGGLGVAGALAACSTATTPTA